MDFSVKSALDLSQRSLEMAKDKKVMDGAGAMDRQQIRKVAEEFESLFLEIVLKSMRSTVPKSGMMDGGNGEDVFRSMLDTEYAKSMAANRSSGIAESIENQLLSFVKDRSDFVEAVKGKQAYHASLRPSPAVSDEGVHDRGNIPQERK